MYRTIDVSMWTDPKFKRLDPTGKLVFAYLVTNPHSHVSGIYYLPKALAAHETGVDVTLLDTVYDTLSGAGFASFDPENEVVWVRNMFRHQGRGSKNEQSARAQLATLHNSFLCHDFCKYYPAVAEGVDLPPLDTVSDTVSKGLPPGTGTGEGSGAEEGTGIHYATDVARDVANQPDTPPPPEPPAPDPPAKPPPVYPQDFLAFWSFYPKKRNKFQALEPWQRAIKRIVIERKVERDAAKECLREAAEAFAGTELGQAGQFCPLGSTWLNAASYDDDRAEWNRSRNGEPDKPRKQLEMTEEDKKNWSPHGNYE